MEGNIAIFEKFKIRRQYDENKEVWYFSVIDIIQVLTEQQDYQKSKKILEQIKRKA